MVPTKVYGVSENLSKTKLKVFEEIEESKSTRKKEFMLPFQRIK